MQRALRIRSASVGWIDAHGELAGETGGATSTCAEHGHNFAHALVRIGRPREFQLRPHHLCRHCAASFPTVLFIQTRGDTRCGRGNAWTKSGSAFSGPAR